MSPRPLDHLPTEVLEEILSYISCKDLWKTLTVSRLWHPIAESLAYREACICLTGQLATQYRLDHHQINHMRNLRALTIKIPPASAAPGQDADAALYDLVIAQILPHAKQLQSFTLLTLDSSRSEAQAGIRPQTLSTLLLALLAIPQLSELILDIDAPYQSYQIADPEDPLHPCTALARLMLQLEHIKLRLPCICRNLIAHYRHLVSQTPAARPLRTFVVNGVFSRPGLPQTERRVSQHCATSPFDRWGAVHETFPTWMGFARSVCEVMPLIERFWVITETRQDGRFVAADRIKREGWCLPAEDWTSEGVSLPPSAIRPWF